MINLLEIAQSLTKKYLFDFSKHYKVWYSPDPNQPLGIENELGLIEFRQKNPNFKLTLIYSQACLSDTAQNALLTFCAQHRIEAVAIESVADNITEPTDKQLYTLLLQEIALARHGHYKGGNMAAASDHTRLMKYTVETWGYFSDSADVSISLQQLGTPYVELKSPILLCTDLIKLPESCALATNNDFLAFAVNSETRQGMDPEAWQCLKFCQKKVLENYQIPFHIERILHTQMPRVYTAYPELPTVLAEFYQQHPHPSVYDFRAYFRTFSGSKADQTRRCSLAQFLLKRSVIDVSGPSNALYFFQAYFPNPNSRAPEILPLNVMKTEWRKYIMMYAASNISFYELLVPHIRSHNSFANIFQDTMTTNKPIQRAHLSWTPSGRTEKLRREAKLVGSAHKIYGFWQENREQYYQRRLSQLITSKLYDREKSTSLLKAIEDKAYSLALRKACFGLESQVVALLLQFWRKKHISLEINAVTGHQETAFDLVEKATIGLSLSRSDRKAEIKKLLKSAGALSGKHLQASFIDTAGSIDQRETTASTYS